MPSSPMAAYCSAARETGHPRPITRSWTHNLARSQSPTHVGEIEDLLFASAVASATPLCNRRSAVIRQRLPACLTFTEPTSSTVQLPGEDP
jgi:hypothetical protein